MMCGMCENHINDAIRTAFKVRKVRSSHRSGTAKVISEKSLDEAALKKLIDSTGYTLRSVSSRPCLKK